MTTDHELHDLLTREAEGAVRPSAPWDEVVRRGRYHQRVRRTGLAATGGVAVVALVAGFGLAADDDDQAITVPATSPTTSVPVEPTAPTTTPGAPVEQLEAGRVQGVFLTVSLGSTDPVVGFDPCTDLHPRVVESPDQVVIELVAATFSSGQPWAGCQSSPLSAFGTIELLDPLDGRTVTDQANGREVPVIDGARLLFPSALPAPFDVERWDEASYPGGPGDTWSFAFSDGDLYLDVVTTFLDPGGPPTCGEDVEVRGVVGRLCAQPNPGNYVLAWDEDGLRRVLAIGDRNSDPAPFTRSEVLAIAEGLESLGG